MGEWGRERRDGIAVRGARRLEHGDGSLGMGAWGRDHGDWSVGMGVWGWEHGIKLIGAWGFESGDRSNFFLVCCFQKVLNVLDDQMI